MPDQAAPQIHFLRMPEVVRRTGMSPATIYRRVKAGLFPPPRKNGALSIWPDTAITAWQARIDPEIAELIG